MTRVLVVDDNEDLQETYEAVLAGEGYEVVRASDGVGALRAVATERPDVVLLDMMMPDVDGLQVLARLPLECPAPLPAVIATSGFDAYRDEALKRGARAFLTKPMELDVLLAAVRAAAADRPLAATVLAHNHEDAVTARARATLLRDELVASLSPAAMARVRARLRALTRWLQRYYGFGATLVQLADGDVLRVEAERGAPPPWLEGYSYPRPLSYCNDVIEAGAPVLLADPLHHPTRHFSRHPEIDAGYRFYAGAPLVTWSGAVIGTLCLVDVEPHVLHAEDMRLLEALALHLAHALEELAAGIDDGDFVLDEDALFSADLLPLLTQIAIERAARVGGVVGVALVQLAHAEDAGEAARAAYDAVLAPGVAVARRGDDEIAIVVAGRGEARGTLADALAASMHAVGGRGFGSAFCRLDAATSGQVHSDDSDLAGRLIALAAETHHAGIIEGALDARL